MAASLTLVPRGWSRALTVATWLGFAALNCGTPVVANDVLVAEAGSAAEEGVWGLVEGSTDPEVLQRFIDLYPNGAHAEEARGRIRELETGGEPAAGLPTLMAPAEAPPPSEVPLASSSSAPPPTAQSSVEIAQLPPPSGNPCAAVPGETPAAFPSTRFGQQVGPVLDLGEPVASATFSGSGKCIIAWSADGTMKLWDAATGQQIGGTMQAEPGVSGVSFAQDIGRLISYSKKAAVLWNAETGERVTSLGVTDALEVYFTVGGTRIWSQSKKGLVRLWDSASGEPIVTINPGEPIQNSAVSNDGRYLLTAADNNGRLKLWDVATGELVHTLGKKGDPPAWGAFSSDDRWVIAGAFDYGETIRLFDVETGEQHGSTIHHPGGSGLFITGGLDGPRILSQPWGGNSFRVWDLETTEQVGKSIKPPGGIYYGMLVGNGSTLLAWSSNGNVRLWDVETGTQLGKTMKQGGSYPWASINAGGTRIATSSDNGQIKLWDAATGEQVGKAYKAPNSKSLALFNPEGTRIYAYSSEGKAKPIGVLDASDGSVIGTVPLEGTAFVGIALNFSPAVALTWAADGTLTMWDAAGQP